MRPTLLAGAASRAMSFAHFASLGAGKKSATKADDTDETKDKAESAEDPDHDESAEDPDKDREDMANAGADDGDEDDDEDKPAASTDDGDGDEDDDEDEDAPPKSKKAKGKGARRPLSADFKRGRRAERRRCAAIFGHAAAAKNAALACHLAFNTGISSAHAIDVLQKTPSAAAPPSSGREARNPRIGPDASRPPADKQAASAWDNAHAKAAGRKAEGGGWDAAHAAAQPRR